MANKNDEILAIENEQRKLADRLAELRKEPESVKPNILIYHETLSNVVMRPGCICLVFKTGEQAEKAKAILEKMEFGDCPFLGGEPIEFRQGDGWTRCSLSCYPGEWKDSPWAAAAWRHGALRRR